MGLVASAAWLHIVDASHLRCIYGACIGKRFCYDSMLLTFSIWLPRGNVDKEVEWRRVELYNFIDMQPGQYPSDILTDGIGNNSATAVIAKTTRRCVRCIWGWFHNLFVRIITIATWLILPVVIRSSKRLSHACLSINALYCETANGSLYQL